MNKDTRVIAALVAADGAILRWQVSDAGAFENAEERGIIRFDADTDCYVHLNATRHDDGSASLPDATLAAWYVNEVGYDPFEDAARAEPPETRDGVREMVRDMADWVARGCPDEREG